MWTTRYFPEVDDQVIFQLPEDSLWYPAAGVRLGADGCLYALRERGGRDVLIADLAEYMNSEITRVGIATRSGTPLEARFLDEERTAPEALTASQEIDQLYLERGRDIRVYLRHLGSPTYLAVLTHEHGWNHPDVTLRHSDLVVGPPQLFAGRVFDGSPHLSPPAPLGARSRVSPLADRNCRRLPALLGV